MNIPVREFALKVGRSEIVIRQQCREGKLICEKLARDWFIEENQDYPFWSAHEKLVHYHLNQLGKFIPKYDNENMKNTLQGALMYALSMKDINNEQFDYYKNKYDL